MSERLLVGNIAMIQVALAIATFLGGIAAIGWFWEKAMFESLRERLRRAPATPLKSGLAICVRQCGETMKLMTRFVAIFAAVGSVSSLYAHHSNSMY